MLKASKFLKANAKAMSFTELHLLLTTNQLRDFYKKTLIKYISNSIKYQK